MSKRKSKNHKVKQKHFENTQRDLIVISERLYKPLMKKYKEEIERRNREWAVKLRWKYLLKAKIDRLKDFLKDMF